MKNLVLTAFVLAAAMPATGCIFVEDDDSDDDDGPTDDDPRDEPTQLNVSWTLLSNAEFRGCLPGAGTATLYACEGTCPAGSTPYSDITDCASGVGAGTIATDPDEALPPGTYIIWVEFAANGTVYAKSFSDPVTLVAGGTVNQHFDVQIDHGFFDASWTLVQGDAAVTCEDVGGVDVALSPSACDAPSPAICDRGLDPDDIFACDAEGGKGTVPRPFATYGYEVGYAVLDDEDQPISAPMQSARGEPFLYGNEAQFIGQLVIEIE